MPNTGYILSLVFVLHAQNSLRLQSAPCAHASIPAVYTQVLQVLLHSA